MTPYTLLVIKPMTIGRGDGPVILEEILDKYPLCLRLFRSWVICDTTLKAWCSDEPDLVYEQELLHTQRQKPSWICLFTHRDQTTDPYHLLKDIPQFHTLPLYFNSATRRTRNHVSDTVIRVARPERVNLEASLLFNNFAEEDI